MRRKSLAGAFDETSLLPIRLRKMLAFYLPMNKSADTYRPPLTNSDGNHLHSNKNPWRSPISDEVSVRQWTSDDHQIGLSRTGTKDHTEPIHVVTSTYARE